jgi:hypothetical protein
MEVVGQEHFGRAAGIAEGMGLLPGKKRRREDEEDEEDEEEQKEERRKKEKKQHLYCIDCCMFCSALSRDEIRLLHV